MGKYGPLWKWILTKKKCIKRLDKLKSARLNKRCAKRQRNCKGRKWKHKNVGRREDHHPSAHLQATVEVVDLHLGPLWETPCQHLLSLQNQHSIQACENLLVTRQ